MKKKQSYSDVWIKAYLAALSRLPADEAYDEANKALLCIKRHLNCAGNERIYTVVKNPMTISILDECREIAPDEFGTFPGNPWPKKNKG